MPDRQPRDVDGKSAHSERRHHPRELARLAGTQLTLVTLDQLVEIGFTRAQIRRRVDAGWLCRRRHRIYSVGMGPLAPKAHLLAAQLSLGDRAFLSHQSAAAVHGLRPVNTHAIDITVPGTGGLRRDGVTVHRTRTDPHPSEVRRAGPLRVSSVPRMLVELAATESEQELGRLITAAVRRRLLRLDVTDGRAILEATLARHARRPGMTKLRRALAAYRKAPGAASDLEVAFDALIAGRPEITAPVPNCRIGPWEIDRFWPAHELAVELDGRPYHVAAADMERDRLKDTDLQRRGLKVMRITDFRLTHDPRGVISDLRELLGPAAAQDSGGFRPAA